MVFDLDMTLVTAVANNTSKNKERYKYFANKPGKVAP